LPSDPLCQPDTDSVKPFGSVPEYQLVNAEIVRGLARTPTPAAFPSYPRAAPRAPAVGAPVRAPSGTGGPGLWRLPQGAVWAKTAPGARSAGLFELGEPQAGTAAPPSTERTPPPTPSGGKYFRDREQPARSRIEGRSGAGAFGLAVLVRAGRRGGRFAATSVEALQALAEAARAVCAAEIALLRAPDETGERLEAVAVSASEALAAELEGTVLPGGGATPIGARRGRPGPGRSASARRARSGATRSSCSYLRARTAMPSRSSCFARVSPSVRRSGSPPSCARRNAALVLRSLRGPAARRPPWPGRRSSSRARRSRPQCTSRTRPRRSSTSRARAAGASAAILWESRDGGPRPPRSMGHWPRPSTSRLRSRLRGTRSTEAGSIPAQAAEDGCPGTGLVSTTLQLGRPPLGVTPAAPIPRVRSRTPSSSRGSRHSESAHAHALPHRRARSVARALSSSGRGRCSR
jgi:hypothetical protein